MTAQKTGKQVNAPVPDALGGLVEKQLKSRPFGPFEVTRHDLRRTFATYMQRIGSAGSAQELLQHSDSRVTQGFYTDQELILRWKVNQLPVDEWLK